MRGVEDPSTQPPLPWVLKKPNQPYHLICKQVNTLACLLTAKTFTTYNYLDLFGTDFELISFHVNDDLLQHKEQCVADFFLILVFRSDLKGKANAGSSSTSISTVVNGKTFTGLSALNKSNLTATLAPATQQKPPAINVSTPAAPTINITSGVSFDF